MKLEMDEPELDVSELVDKCERNLDLMRLCGSGDTMDLVDVPAWWSRRSKGLASGDDAFICGDWRCFLELGDPEVNGEVNTMVESTEFAWHEPLHSHMLNSAFWLRRNNLYAFSSSS